MYSLFSTKSGEAGYRLQYFEAFNWGTFDKEVFRISPQCNTTLITGANGSGKTTFIQGLLTLIVPEKRYRFYEHQRTEDSYVLGEYGDIETESGRQIQRIRDDKSKAYSILLATFKNEERYVTLIQTRWFAGSEMKRKYIIAFKPLTIEGDISPFDSKGEWLRNLNKKYPKIGTKELIQPFDGPSKYAEALLKVFGMRSSKALTLFDQTMRLKVLGSLDQFVRENMLEESKIEDDFQNLRNNYQKLLDAHHEMQKAEKQLELLKPVKENAEELEKTKNELLILSELRETSPIYFYHKKKNFLETEIENESLELKRITEKELELKNEIDTKRETEKILDSDIRNDETGKQIQELDKEIKVKTADKTRREDRLNRYNKAAIRINFDENPSEELFYEQITKATRRHEEVDDELKNKENGIQKRLRILENEKETAEKQHEEKAKELDELTKQKNNITGRISEIQQEILAITGATQSEIPFIGELIQILPKEKNWEMAIEKVLHNFALRLIVPDEYYKQVNEYVNEKDLKEKIRYERFQKENFMNSLISKDKDSIFSKIEIKRDSRYADWIENQIKTKYNFICTSKDDLPSYNKAVTSNGLIKNGTLHEKDDRQKALSRENFVLGWDNKEKIKLTRESLKQIENIIKSKRDDISKLEKRQKRLEDEKEDITKFLLFENYSDIDWKEISLEIQNLIKRRDELEKSNDRVNLLRTQLSELQTIISLKDNERDKLIEGRTIKKSLVVDLENQFNQCSFFLEDFKDIVFTEKFLEFEGKFKTELDNLCFGNLNSRNKAVSDKLTNDIEHLIEIQRKLELKLQSSMQNFKQPDDSIIQVFKDWTSDTHKLGKEITFVDDYLEIFNRIEREELIENRTKFKNYLNDNMIKGVSDFKTLLDNQEEQILESIEALNESLKKIDFKKNPQTTFIQLFAEKENSKDIQDFRLSLKEWKPDIAEYERTKDDQILESSFLKIKELITKLTEKEDWRKRVTDVRNWLKFLAKEFYREDMKRPPKVYDNTAKLSSGEQAQITYTIMGAAIAYQYGILKDGMNTNSFRFICVDEAFAKQDEEKAVYLMDLTQKLNLQMLLVTPDDKIQIAEPYISGVHIVHRVNNRNSRIFDTTIEQAKKLIDEKTLTTSDYSS
ncbi:MAG TPA: SbcC/MukB-like Walker B domain-containing protein [Tenuifilaceae bacterium]|nr:SbcC/MukB-like Walker B domain-containing protein [Tenuifilaceae bacterium]